MHHVKKEKWRLKKVEKKIYEKFYPFFFFNN